MLLAATIPIFVAGLALPDAFGAEGWLFALACVLVRALPLVGLSGFRLRVAGERGYGGLAVCAPLMVLHGLKESSPAWLVRGPAQG